MESSNASGDFAGESISLHGLHSLESGPPDATCLVVCLPVLSFQAAAIENVARRRRQSEEAMSKSTAFSPDYAAARLRFRQAATVLGWTLEAHSIGLSGPRDEDLTE